MIKWSRKSQRAFLVAGIVGIGALLAPIAALGSPGGTGHTVTMTEITHGVFDADLSGPNPCSGAEIVSEDVSYDHSVTGVERRQTSSSVQIGGRGRARHRSAR